MVVNIFLNNMNLEEPEHQCLNFIQFHSKLFYFERVAMFRNCCQSCRLVGKFRQLKFQIFEAVVQKKSFFLFFERRRAKFFGSWNCKIRLGWKFWSKWVENRRKREKEILDACLKFAFLQMHHLFAIDTFKRRIKTITKSFLEPLKQ